MCSTAQPKVSAGLCSGMCTCFGTSALMKCARMKCFGMVFIRRQWRMCSAARPKVSAQQCAAKVFWHCSCLEGAVHVLCCPAQGECSIVRSGICKSVLALFL